jgi:hypothetical protein
MDLQDKVQDNLKQMIILHRYVIIQEMITDLTYADINSRRITLNKPIVSVNTLSKSSTLNSR